MNKKKYFSIALIFICIISITLIGTYALKLWSSTNNTELTFRIGEYSTNGITCKTSEDITVSDIGPIFDYNVDGEIIPFTVVAGSSNEEKLYINFNIENITSNLKEESFKYILLSSIDKTNYNEVVSGNFLNANSNDTIELISNYVITKTTYYKLIIYIDGNMENPISMQNGSITGNLEVCTDGALLVTPEVLEKYKVVTNGEEFNKSYSCTNSTQTETLSSGIYTLQVWGAQGGYGYDGSSNKVGGKGGYSTGKLTLTSDTIVYINVGCRGEDGTTNFLMVKQGGFNGGGKSGYYYGASGGGATDIRLLNNSLYARVIVAGGGGGGANPGYGGPGGGLSGIDGGTNTAGTISAGGNGGSSSFSGTDGSFGLGGAAWLNSSDAASSKAGGGGGGWYGGGGGGASSGGGGGSGWVYTEENYKTWKNGNFTDSGNWLLNSEYYLTDASTTDGTKLFESTTSGVGEYGHQGDGYAKITGTATIISYTIPYLTGLTDLNILIGTNIDLSNDITLICENNATSGCSIESISVTDTSKLTAGDYVITYAVNGKDNKKYLFNRNLTVSAPVKDASGANSPDLVQGLIPVMYDGNNWVKADITNNNSTYKWHDYNNKLWANAVLVSDTNRSKYQSVNVGSIIPESDILAYYVWIPRYKYKVWNINKVAGTDSYNAYNTGIDIVFENEKGSTGTISCNYDFTVIEGNGLSEKCTGSNGDYYTHPAFTFGNDELRGFWIGKFELTGDSSKLTILPNLVSLRKQSISSFNTLIQNMQASSNIYGLNTSRTNTDSHMITNYEWGAVAYLTNSKYGRCTNGECSEVTINNCSTFITGIAGDSTSASESSSTCTTTTNKYNGTKGVLASTTGNITGVYDMSGGAYEYTMGNVSSSSGSYTFYSSNSEFTSSWYTANTAKYLTTYAYGTNEKNQAAYNRGRLGDATGEVVLSAGSSGGGVVVYATSGSEGWYDDWTYFPRSSYSWHLRSGRYYNSSSAGVFAFYYDYGQSSDGDSTRAIIVSF